MSIRPPMLDLRGYRSSDLARDAVAAGVVGVLSVPQGVAYAMIAGLPPSMGLYAAALPAIIGSLARSSRHVVTGPTNALSLLVGGAAVSQMGLTIEEAAVTLAVMVGIFQAAAGSLRLGPVVDYISRPVVLGYITGAGVLIGVGQLKNITDTPADRGTLLETLSSWAASAADFNALAVLMGLGTAALIAGLRRVDRRVPGALVAMGGGIGLDLTLDLKSYGLQTLGELAPIPAGLPPLTMPSLGAAWELLPLAVACTVLSLVESSAVARSIAARSGQRLDLSLEFIGQGLANIAAGFSGGYPISGSLSRSALNEQAGARSRLAGAFAGAFMLLVLLLLGPLVDHTPVASLAGLLLIIAWDLVRVPRIIKTLKAGRADRLAFLATLLGTWLMPLDKAIYLGVGISLIFFLRSARLLIVRELALGPRGRLREVPPDVEHEAGADLSPSGFRRCGRLRILHVEGAMFYGAAGELQAALDDHVRDPDVKALIVRLKRAHGMDITTAEVLEEAAGAMRKQGRALILVGMRPGMMAALERAGTLDVIGAENAFPTRPGWFVAMDEAIQRGLEVVQGESACSAADVDCPLEGYLAERAARRGEQRVEEA